MNEKRVLQLFGKANAVIVDSHIVYTSGKHGSAYVNKDAVYPYLDIVTDLCSGIAMHFCGDGPSPAETVIGPALGGIILAQWVAYDMTCFVRDGQKEAPHPIYAEKADDGNFVIKRGYDKFVTGKKVLVVEDVLTTGGSVRKVVEAIRAIDGEVIGVGALCNRGGVTAEDIGNVPELFALVNITLDAYPEEECPLCRDLVPIRTDIGKGADWIKTDGGQKWLANGGSIAQI